MTQGARRAKTGAQTLRVSDVMERVAKLVPPATRATDALEQMESERLDHLIVFSGKTLLGVVSRRDLDGVILGAKTVAAFMTTRPVSVDPKTTLEDASALLRGRSAGFLPVLERGQLVGLITLAGALSALCAGRGTVARAR